MANTAITKKMETHRNSEETQKFKEKIEDFLNKTSASGEIKYKLSCDLAKKSRHAILSREKTWQTFIH